jgi:hypothetical protein
MSGAQKFRFQQKQILLGLLSPSSGIGSTNTWFAFRLCSPFQIVAAIPTYQGHRKGSA